MDTASLAFWLDPEYNELQWSNPEEIKAWIAFMVICTVFEFLSYVPSIQEAVSSALR